MGEMAENSVNLWRTIAIGTVGLLMGLGGSMLTVEIRLASIKSDLAYQIRAIGELQGIIQARGKQLEDLRATDTESMYQRRGLEKRQAEIEAWIARLEARLTRLEHRLGQLPKEIQ